MATLTPFLLLWAASALGVAMLGAGAESLFLGLAPVGLVALWAEGRSARRSLWPVAFVAGVVAMMTSAPMPLLWPFAAAGAIWLPKLLRFSLADSRSRRHERDLERATRSGRLSFAPDTGIDAMAFRAALEQALRSDPMRSIALVQTAPDTWLLPPPGPDMDNGIEAFADNIAGSEPELALRLYRIAEQGCAIEFGHATSGGAGLATSARLKALRTKIRTLADELNDARGS